MEGDGDSWAAITWYRVICGDVCVIIVPKDKFQEALELLPERGFRTYVERLETAKIPFEFIPQDRCYEHLVEDEDEKET